MRNPKQQNFFFQHLPAALAKCRVCHYLLDDPSGSIFASFSNTGFFGRLNHSPPFDADLPLFDLLNFQNLKKTLKMMKPTNYPELQPEQQSNVLTYTDPDKVAEIDHHYVTLMKEIRNSTLLTEEEKMGQRAFLHQYWQEELKPYLALWRVRLYVAISDPD